VRSERGSAPSHNLAPLSNLIMLVVLYDVAGWRGGRG